ncbi:MAG: ABC transporter ATP-binding protein [Marinosulfonomonas sp.]
MIDKTKPSTSAKSELKSEDLNKSTVSDNKMLGVAVADISTWTKAWKLIAREDRRAAVYALFVVIASALSSALMVASALPFFAVLADTNIVSTMPVFGKLSSVLRLETRYSLLLVVGLGSFAIILAASAMQVWRLLVVEHFAVQQAYKISRRVLGVYLSQPYVYFLDRHGSDMATIVLSEVGETISFFIRPAMQLIAGLITTVAISILLFWVNPQVSVTATLIIGTAYGIGYWITQRRVRIQGQIRIDSNENRYRVTNEAFGGIKAVKAMGLEKQYLKLYEQPAKKMADAIFSIRVASQLPSNLIYALASGGVIFLCLFLVDEDAFENGAALGELIPMLGVFGFAAQRLIPELHRIYSSATDMKSGIAAINRLYDDMQATKEVLSRGDTKPLGLKRELRIKDVGFAYPNTTGESLTGINISLAAGQKVGIVGSTGAGKTTLADLFLGLLRPTSGQIIVDGKPLNADNIVSWQRSIGYVPQDIFLSDSTVAENIAFGLSRDEIDFGRVRKAARIADIADLIENELVNGYDTTLGERGVRLSGGQRQRVGIARAVYRDADLIVFDEATSALDSLTEGNIMAALNSLPSTKTNILIAHRLSTVRTCDQIVVLQKGKILDIGTWDDLLERCEVFQDLVDSSKLEKAY